jgi:hypothetical protein
VAAECSPPKRRFTQDLRGATSQKTAFFIVTAVKTSNLTRFLLFAKPSRPILVHRTVPETLFLGVKRPGSEDGHSAYLMQKLKMCNEITLKLLLPFPFIFCILFFNIFPYFFSLFFSFLLALRAFPGPLQENVRLIQRNIPRTSASKSFLTHPSQSYVHFFIIIIWFVRLLTLRPLLAYCAILGW